VRLEVEDRVVDFELDAVIKRLVLAVPVGVGVFVGICVPVVEGV